MISNGEKRIDSWMCYMHKCMYQETCPFRFACVQQTLQACMQGLVKPLIRPDVIFVAL